jgi:hypothetical protein
MIQRTKRSILSLLPRREERGGERRVFLLDFPLSPLVPRGEREKMYRRRIA